MFGQPPRHAAYSDYIPWPDITEAAGQDAVATESYSNFGLNDLLRYLVAAITGQDARRHNYKEAAQALLGHARGDRTLLTPEVTAGSSA